jgi:hypothetical protein
MDRVICDLLGCYRVGEGSPGAPQISGGPSFFGPTDIG